MKERPILFSSPMVQAILGGRKTQTRRILKHEVESDNCIVIKKLSPPRINVRDPRFLQFCPYGVVGDQLWVRETTTEEFMGSTSFTKYVADGHISYDEWSYSKTTRPSIFMPRNFSRILLEITNVRVERLNDITDTDAIAEGIERLGNEFNCSPWRNYRIGKVGEMDMHCSCPRRSYMTLWESINGAGSWAENQFVWVITFKVVEIKR
ncbi:MAG: hypothetical protein Q7S87_04920 [Agitococcus sp.]|nr:hypothetical protein [Agitococcus sp.]